MHSLVTTACKGSIAKFAFEWFVSSMCIQVFLQLMWINKTFSTKVTSMSSVFMSSMILMNMKFHFSFGYHHSTYQAWNLFMDTHNMTFQHSFISFDFTTVRTYNRSMIMNKLHVIGQIGDNGSTLVTNSFYSQEVEVLLVLYVHEIFFLVCA